MKRVVAALVGGLFVLLAVGSASAQTYPPGSPALAVSATVVTVGESVTATVTGFPVDVVVTFTFESTPITLGSATTNSSGVASLTFAVPSVAAGAHEVIASGGGVSQVVANITVVASGQTALPTNNSSLARTGADVALLVLAALVLVGAGAGALAFGRRRRSNTLL